MGLVNLWMVTLSLKELEVCWKVTVHQKYLDKVQRVQKEKARVRFKEKSETLVLFAVDYSQIQTGKQPPRKTEGTIWVLE